ncbi:MAG: pyridoxal phosphate-dependent aminotransferase [Thermoanaerobaculia bacterium]
MDRPPELRLTNRALSLRESATLAVARRAAELRAAGERVIDFSVGEPDFPSPEGAVSAARQALADGFTRYTQVAGIPELRQALARRYAEEYDAPWTQQEVIVTAGAKAALFELALALFEPGVEVVVPTPCWVSFPAQVGFAGAEMVPVATDPADEFRLHAEPLLAAINVRTAAVILNAPCNPTGGVIEVEELERLAEGCAERGVLLIADETYDRFVYGGRPRVSAAVLARQLPDTVVVVGSFSKTWAMTGWRLGYCLGPPALIQALIAIQGHATSNPTSFAMAGALAALEEGEEEFRGRLREFEARRDLVVERLAALPGVECPRPAGAFYAFPHVARLYREDRQGSVALASFLLEEARVAVVPGLAFEADDHLRLSFACSREELEEGLDRIAAAIAATV